MTTDADFTSSSPARWATAIERAAVIREFLAKYPRTAETADEYAARLGMRRSGFYRLVRAFRINHDAMPPERADQGRPRLDADAEAVIADAIRQAPATDLAGLQTTVRRLSEERGIAAPSRTAMRARLLPSAGSRVPGMPGRRFVFDEVDLGIGVRDGRGLLVTPTLSALVQAASGILAGHWLGMDADMDARAAAASDAAEANGFLPPSGEPIPTGQALREDRIRLLVAERPSDRGSTLLAALGLRLGAIALRPRLRQHPVNSRNVVEVELEVARDAVRRLVALHNAGRGGSDGPTG